MTLNNIILTSLVLSCVVLAHCKTHKAVAPRTEDAPREVDFRGGNDGNLKKTPETTVNLHAKWQLRFDPEKQGQGERVKVMKSDTNVDIVPVQSYQSDESDDEGDDEDDLFSIRDEDDDDNGAWEEDFGSGSGSDIVVKPPSRPPPANLPKPPRRGPSTDKAKETPADAVKASCGNSVDSACLHDDDPRDDAIFGVAKDDWIEGDDTDLDDAIFGKVNSTWTWGKIPDKSHEKPEVQLTSGDELRMKEAVVMALRSLTAAPCAAQRRQNDKCKALQDIVRDLSLLGLVFSPGRS